MKQEKQHEPQEQLCPLCNTPQLDPIETNCAICGFDFSIQMLEAEQTNDSVHTADRQTIDFLLDEIHLINVLCAL